jgi:hypothetical protein
MITAQQIGAIPVSSAQAPTVPMQAGVIPAQTNGGLDISSIMNMLIMVMVIVMMMKVMTGATEKI